MRRRDFLKTLSALSVSLTGCQYLPLEGFSNPCHEAGLPKHLREHELIQATWEGIDTNQVWDCHTHLVGVGDSDSGIWVNPNMQSWLHPISYIQFKFYLNGSCVTNKDPGTADKGFVKRLLQLHRDMPAGFRFMLLAFDYYHDEKGKVIKENSVFYTPNKYALQMKQGHKTKFEWIASIHPYREDWVEAFESAVRNNARAIKWLPGAMGINPESPLCDRFYEALVKHNIPLLTHAGTEHAVDVAEDRAYDNPLLFRRALEHGVRVIFAHCATLGENVDIDKGPNGPIVTNLDLFGRLMSESRYENQVFGDISAITQVNRDRHMIEKIVTHEDWHDRLIYGSDYPLPGVMPIFSPQNFVSWNYLPENEAAVLSEIRQYNPILFDIMLKRRLNIHGHSLATKVFESRRFFVPINDHF